MAEWLTLIERLEKLDGPSREVDALIWCVEAPEMVDILPHWSEEQQEEIVPRFTGSLDEAVELVERMMPGWWWQISAGGGDSPLGFVGQPDCTAEAHQGSNPAIALLLALLKALEGGNKP